MQKDHPSKQLHAINNLLASISLSGELLYGDLKKTATKEQKKFLKGITPDTKKIQRLLKKLNA